MRGISQMKTKPVIKFDDLSFSYNGNMVLEDATFEIFPKDYVWIVGPNGGGKTTLLKLALGLLKPKKGRLSLFGSDPAESRKMVGYMTQHVELDFQYPLTVFDIAAMGAISNRFGFLSREVRNRVSMALDEVNMSKFSNRSFAELSGGERRRLLIARALASDPKLLILDEPTANLDQHSTTDLYHLLERLNERLTIVMVSHDPAFVSQSVKRVLCVHRHVHEHPVGEIDAEFMGDMMGAQIKMIRHDKKITPDS